MLFPLSLAGVLSHMTVLRMLLLSAEPAMEPPGDLGAFEGRRGLGEHGGLGRGVEGWAGEGRKTLKKKKKERSQVHSFCNTQEKECFTGDWKGEIFSHPNGLQFPSI